MKKIVLILDQIQSGAGTKDDSMVPLAGKPGAIGPALMMERMLEARGLKVAACLYCGTGFFQAHQKQVIEKMAAMLARLQVQGILCGPCYNDPAYAAMAAALAYELEKRTHIPAVAAMAAQNREVIARYAGLVPIVRMPKKGDTGLNEALVNIAEVLAGRINDQEFDPALCFTQEG